jgi:hypothetical protein
MLTTNPSVPIYLHSEPIDMRKSFDGLLPREIVEVAIPEDFKKRIKSGEMIVIRESIRESLKFVPPKLVVVEYREPVLAFANTPDQEIPVQGEANLGDKGRRDRRSPDQAPDREDDRSQERKER